MGNNLIKTLTKAMDLMEMIYESDSTKKPVPTEARVFTDANCLKAKVGTTGYKGGDSGHGCRTVFKLTDSSGTDLRVSINRSCYFPVEEVGLLFGGDSELSTFIQVLEFALETLKSQTKKEEP